MILKGKELEAMIDKFDASAQKNWATYQATGMTRYETAWRNAEDLADTLRVAQSAVDDHAALVHCRGWISQLAHQARRTKGEHKDLPKDVDRILADLISIAQLEGLIGKE